MSPTSPTNPVSPGPTTADRPSWSNWSGSVRCEPDAVATPRDRDELRRLLAGSDAAVRVRGSGHSFTPLCATDATLVDLSAMPGDVLARDVAAGTVTLQAGASLHDLSRAIDAQGVAFKNLGDIDVQSLAGATATATHGTGRTLPCLSGEVEALTLVTADGEEVHADREHDPDLLRAARVSLGALGVVVEATVAVRTSYSLHRRVTVRPLRELLTDVHDLWQQHRNVEFFAVPHCSHALLVVHDETDQEPRSSGGSDDEAALRTLRRVRSLLWRTPRLRRLVLDVGLARTPAEEVVGPSWRLLANERTTRFHELEHHLPVAEGLDALAEVLAVVESERPEVFFPIECRMTAADDSLLSPFHDGPRISVAVHAHQPDDHAWLVERIEPLLARRGGRPHWGKLHGFGPDRLREAYPDYDRFRAVRAELDPRGRFLNPHLAALLDVPLPTPARSGRG